MSGTARARWGGRIVRLLGGLAVGFALVETVVRVAWDGMPDALYPSAEVEVQVVEGSDGKPHERMRGHDLYHRFRHNHRGLRGPEIPPRAAGALRVALVGDSFVYGIGVSEQDSIPGQLQLLLRTRTPGAEVLNAGTPGAGLEHHADRVASVVRDYRPDVLVLVLLYNDFEFADTQVNAGSSLDTAGVRVTGHTHAVGTVAHAMLPVTDPRYPAPPGAAPPPWSVSLRYALARHWWSYAYIALHARMLGTDWDSAERDVTLLHTDSPQVRRIAFGRLEGVLRSIRAVGDNAGVKVGVTMFMDGNLGGIPALRVREAIAESGVPALDLAPLWGSLSEYARHHSLRYDNHPNRAANRAAATRIACWLADAGWLGVPGSPGRPGTASDARCMERHAARVARYLDEQRAAAVTQRERIASLECGFRPALVGDERDPAVRRAQASQWLLGWIPDDAGRRLVTEGGVRLRAGDGGARGVRAVGRALDPSVNGVALACADARGEAHVGAGGVFDVTVARTLTPGEVVECVLRPLPATPASPVTSGEGVRRGATVQLTRIGLE